MKQETKAQSHFTLRPYHLALTPPLRTTTQRGRVHWQDGCTSKQRNTQIATVMLEEERIFPKVLPESI
ncbi:hypothetical protein AOLI_G00259640 [Acnodon oligacanthus]